MRLPTLVAAAAATAAGAIASRRGVRVHNGLAYVPTPAGYMRNDCVHSVPSMATLTRQADGSVMVQPESDADGAPYLIPRCPLPPDYDGWLEYANVTSPDMTTGFNIFTSTFSVPTGEPASDPDILYLFPGLQNIDWIPLHDPEPSDPFDIIQPVLQYPADTGVGYSVKSWWVTLDAGAMASNEVALADGALIFGNMTKTGAESWYIDSVDVASGKHTAIKASGLGARLRSQPWAYVTLECYGCTSCSTYPPAGTSCAFSDMALIPVGATQPIAAAWQANAKPSAKRVCHESIDIVNGTNVNIYFNGQ